MIKISTGIRYALRSLIYIAVNYTGKPLSLKEIARDQEISKKYLESLFSLLKNAGLVHSSRGSIGGYWLGKNPEDITIFEVFYAIDGPINLVDCATNPASCSRTGKCETINFYKEMQDNLSSYLTKTRLSDIVTTAEKEKIAFLK